MAKAVKVRSPWDRDDDISILKTVHIAYYKRLATSSSLNLK